LKILVAGDGHSELHEKPVINALRELGHDARGFLWHDYFKPATGPIGRLLQPWLRAQDKFVRGPAISRLNAGLVRECVEMRPDLLFIYRGTHVKAATLREIRKRVPGITIAGYNNDDPFGPGQPRYRWRHFLDCLPECDVTLAYRHHNLEEFSRYGAKRVRLLRSWFIPERNHPVALTPQDEQQFATDVVFVGHYENDGRLELLEAVASKGFRLRLFGPGYDWDPVLAGSAILKHLRPVRLVWGEDYNKALCGAKVALCFFSRLNRDTYTRRCFEIPATGTLMLSEYSDDLATLFAEGREADYFRSRDELLAKLDLYLGDDTLRSAVAQAGLQRVNADGHDLKSRLRDLLAWMTESGLTRGLTRGLRNGQSHA
jgi:spore maturation protein CgeB